MGRSFGIINLIAVIFLSSLIYAYIVYVQKENEDFESLRLSYQIDFAVDAGTAAMLGTSDLGMDYANEKFTSVNPQLALDTFLTVFAFGYDMLPTEENKALIKEFIPAVGIATFDGYYIASHKVIKNSVNYPDVGGINDADWDLKFGMKLPYTYSYGTAKYAVNMSTSYSWKLEGTNLTRHEGFPPTLSGPMTKDGVWRVINKAVSDDMAYTISEFNDNNPNWSNQFYIPDKLTNLSGVNPVQGPSMVVLVQNLNITTSRKISGFGVGGAKIDNVRMVGVYERDGKKFYSFVDKLPPGVDLENVYSSVKDAAEAGYYADMEYLF